MEGGGETASGWLVELINKRGERIEIDFSNHGGPVSKAVQQQQCYDDDDEDELGLCRIRAFPIPTQFKEAIDLDKNGNVNIITLAKRLKTLGGLSFEKAMGAMWKTHSYGAYSAVFVPKRDDNDKAHHYTVFFLKDCTEANRSAVIVAMYMMAAYQHNQAPTQLISNLMIALFERHTDMNYGPSRQLIFLRAFAKALLLRKVGSMNPIG